MVCGGLREEARDAGFNERARLVAHGLGRMSLLLRPTCTYGRWLQ